MTRAVHQFVPTFELGAIGNEALVAQQVFRNAGFASEIFAEHVRDDVREKAHVHTSYDHVVASNGQAQHADDTNDANDVIFLYHMAIGSVVADWLKDRSETLILRYHNITPADYYAVWPGGNTHGMTWGRAQLDTLRSRTTLALAASHYNAHELEELHYERVRVAPVLFDFETFVHATSSDSARIDTGAQWLFVGWIAPHKCQHDIIAAFALYRELYDPHAHLHLVGRTGLESYETACRSYAHALHLDAAVTFHGRVSDAQLGALYRDSDALVCLSEHEGVGLPLLEAMRNNLPIVGFSAAAVTETIGDAGIVLGDKTPLNVAAAVHRVTHDRALRDILVVRGQVNLRHYTLAVGAKAFLDAVNEVAAKNEVAQ